MKQIILKEKFSLHAKQVRMLPLQMKSHPLFLFSMRAK
jgi:hypothetical protein